MSKQEKTKTNYPVIVNLQPKDGLHLTQDQQESLKKWSQLVKEVWADDKLKQRLMDNPRAVLQEHGIAIPAGAGELRVVENTDKVSYLMLPPKPAGSELTLSQLEGVVGARTGPGDDDDKMSGGELAALILLGAGWDAPARLKG